MSIAVPDCRDEDLDGRGRGRLQAEDDLPAWARWNRASERHYAIGVEEELMLLNPLDFTLAQSGEKVLRRLSGELRGHTAPQTHASVITLATGIHSAVAGAVESLAALRARLDRELRAMGLIAASTGTYPLAFSGEARVSGSARQGVVAESMRMLARREPTLAMHVHISVPDPEDAICLLNRLRGAMPLLLALSANSPFSKGQDSGFASARTVIFQSFPRTGIAREFASYADYVHLVDVLIGSGALPDPSFLWWDARLRPALGTVEVRAMDAQMSVADSAALVALIHCLARLVPDGHHTDRGADPEVLAENRFLAARDGLNARLIDQERRTLVPVRALLDALLIDCRARADAVGAVELDRVRRLLSGNGAERQRRWARENGLDELLSAVTQRYATSGGRSLPSDPTACLLTRATVAGRDAGRSRPATEGSAGCLVGSPIRGRQS